jgi:hypothetical protein
MPKGKNNSGMSHVEEQLPDSDIRYTNSDIRYTNSAPNSPDKTLFKSPKKKVQSLYKEPWQIQLDALTTQVTSLAHNMSSLLQHKEKRKDKAGKPSPIFLSKLNRLDKVVLSDQSSQDDSDCSTLYSRSNSSKIAQSNNAEQVKIQAVISRSQATYNLSFMKGLFLSFLGLMDEFYTSGILLYLPGGKVYLYGPIKKEENRLSLASDGLKDPVSTPPQQRLICAFPTNLADFITFGSLIKNMVSYAPLGTDPFLTTEAIRANTASEITEAFNFYHEKFLFTENQDKFNHLTNFAVCMHYFLISWNYAIMNHNLQLILMPESKELWKSMKGHYVKDTAYHVPEYPLNDILHLFGSYCPCCLRRGNCVLFCESCFAKKPAKDKANATITQWSDLNLLQHKIVLNGSRKGLNKSMGLATF